MKKSRQEVLEARKQLMEDATAKSLVKRGDKRISSPSRICSVCGTPLSGINYQNGKALAKRNHWHLQYSKYLYIDICESASTCCRRLGVEK